MHLRRSLATAAAATLLVVPLSSCGSDYNTNRVNVNAAGTYDKSGSVDVIAATIVSSGPDAGTFIANLSNNDQTRAATFVELVGTGEAAIEPADFEPVEIPPGYFVNLADGGLGIKVTGDFDSGDVVTLQLGFEAAGTVELDVPVVLECEEYAGLDPAVPGEEPVELAPAVEQQYSCDQFESDPGVDTEPEPGTGSETGTGTETEQ